MRSRPAHISQTTASTTSRRALPANKKDPHGGPRRRLPLDKPPLHISSIQFRSVPLSMALRVTVDPCPVAERAVFVPERCETRCCGDFCDGFQGFLVLVLLGRSLGW